jgi:subtilisin family serine protease
LTGEKTPLQLASGFSWAWQNGIDVISNSWGGYAPSTIIQDAIQNAIDLGRNGLGCVVVFAAGNENSGFVRYPGRSIPEILVVGAMSPCGEVKHLQLVMVKAHGEVVGDLRLMLLRQVF